LVVLITRPEIIRIGEEILKCYAKSEQHRDQDAKGVNGER